MRMDFTLEEQIEKDVKSGKSVDEILTSFYENDQLRSQNIHYSDWVRSNGNELLECIRQCMNNDS